MSLEAQSRALLAELSVPKLVSDTFLALFNFVDQKGVLYQWLELDRTENLLKGPAFRARASLVRSTLRNGITNNTPLTDLADLLQVRDPLQRSISTGVVTAEDSLCIVVALRLVDDAYRGLHPGEVGDVADGIAFAALRTKLRLGLPIFETADAKVYPRPRRIGAAPFERGQSNANELLSHLCVIRPSKHVDFEYLVNLSTRAMGGAGFGTIGVIPVIAASNELHWGLEGDDHYSVREMAALRGTIEARVKHALIELCNAKADLIVLPELVSGTGLFAFLQTELQKLALAGSHTPTILFAGTQLVSDGTAHFNRGHVLDWEGEPVWSQDKLHAFLFLAKDQKACGSPLGTTDYCDRLELLTPPQKIRIVDVSPSHRLTVLICEDFIQDRPHRDAVVDFRVTTIIAPVMMASRNYDPKLGKHEPGWVKDAGVRYANHPGASSVVSNSGALLTSHQDMWFAYTDYFTNPPASATWEAIVMPSERWPVAWVAKVPR